MNEQEVVYFKLVNCGCVTRVIEGNGKMRSLDRSLGCKHYANEARLLITYKLLCMFFKAQLFTDFLYKIARSRSAGIFIACV